MGSADRDNARNWLLRGLELWPGGLPEARRSEYETVIAEVHRAWGAALWNDLPGLMQEVFGFRGWEWNGIYARADDTLVLVSAAGPPVCGTLLRQGGVGSSGMCWDGILMNQTLSARDVSHWPGYVSCDRESGLSTAAGIVCPIRDAAGTPEAVWDLDSVEPLAAEDPVFCDHLFATLSVLLPGPPGGRWPSL